MVSKERYGPWALLLGGSEGIGEHIARRLAAVGINIILVARKPEPLAETSAMLRATYGVEVRTIELDISRPDMLERIREVTDGLEVGFLLHNVSGGQRFGPFVDQPIEPALAMVAANPIATVKLSHHFGAPMAARGRGAILFMGSLGAIVGSYALAAYSASKAFNQVFAEALWAELQPRGVDVLDFLVGLTDTPSYKRSGTSDANSMPLGKPEEIAQLALEQLSNGPIQVAPENAEYFKSLYAMSRREGAELKRKFMSRNLGSSDAR